MWAKTSERSHTAIALACVIFLAACGGSSGSPAPDAGVGGDSPPTANAGSNQVVVEGTTVQLQGVGSDAEGPVTFDWIQIIGPHVTLSDSTIANPSFVVPNVPIGATEPIVFRLTVTDSTGNSVTDDITITIDSNDFIVFSTRGEDFLFNELFKYETKTGSYLSLSGALAAQFPSADIQTFAVSPDGGHIAYEFDFASGSVLNVVRTDGLGQVTVTEISNSPDPPIDLILDIRWAPDGSRFAYQVTDANQDSELYSVGADGTGNFRISSLTNSLFFPNRWAWAADSARLAYLADPGGTGSSQLYTARPDGTDVQQVSAAGAQVEFWAWEPNGTRLAYAAMDGNSALELYTVRPDGSDLANISAGAGLYRASMWSWAPDSSRIAFVPDGSDGAVALNTVLPDGSDHTELCGPTVTGWNCHGALWSPDGSRVAFVGDGLNISNPDGTDRVNLPTVNPFDKRMRWSPDGSRVAYDATQIYVMASNDGTNTLISGLVFEGGRATLSSDAWAPDASRIKYNVTGTDPAFSFTHEVWTATSDGALSDLVLRGDGMPRVFVGIEAGYWSRDGSRILYAARTNLGRVLRIALPNGAIETTIVAPNGDDVGIADPEELVNYSEPTWWP
jgi:Tol biopolymer transport system component